MVLVRSSVDSGDRRQIQLANIREVSFPQSLRQVKAHFSAGIRAILVVMLISGAWLAMESISKRSVEMSDEYPPSRRVNTTYGPIEGRRLIYKGDRHVDAFQGIPYAAPPVGDLRFALPQAHEKWTSVRETKKFGNRGIQIDQEANKSKYEQFPQGEDNLSLNVFTPVWEPSSKNGFPVLVFIHGGGFVIDSAVKYGDLSICKGLVMKDVVVVTVQYRLGFLGFWTTGDEEFPDNLALHDMTFALKWIRDNIAAFNGDAENITLMGQSAGGVSVDLLSISPVSRDLFHKVIPMGGSASNAFAIHNTPLSSCRTRAKKMGVFDDGDSKELIEKLRKVPAEKFAAAMVVSLFEKTEDEQCLIGPKYDHVFLPKPIKQLRKEAPVKPRLVGCSRSEGLMLYTPNINKEHPVHQIREDLKSTIPEKFFPTTAKHHQKEIMKRLIDPSKDLKNLTKDEWIRAIIEIRGDNFIHIGIQKNVLDVLEATPDAPIYFYSFEYSNPKANEAIGGIFPFYDATHCTDISYVVGSHIVGQFEWNDDDLKMIDVTTRLWTNFAKYGDPNGRTEKERNVLNGVQWLPATAENPQLNLALSLTPRMDTQYKKGRPHYVAQLRQKTMITPFI
ncbi:unnamed protein product [Caenorhabditis bovis]|uniref:Carboxylesterase type B domain-containing protein n=1 Tax=Caenorhabditis bovis TaxID=2654633 RepID=A0A8S1EL91_9PELO|nr:unnamed protein product [Caenorhabditis bovis]